jgi:hypothetical protein
VTDSPAPFELFHRIADRSSAKVRRFIVDHALEPLVRFRNVEYDEPQRDLTVRGGTEVPALWDGARLVVGAEAIVARLLAHGDVGRQA